jgi:hypothetical protein
MPSTAVVYLFWAPLGVDPLERFARSFTAHPAGRDHELIVLRKAIADPGADERSRAVAAQLGGRCLTTPATGLDVDAYRWAAEHLTAATLCFLNTSSEILAGGWLRALSDALEQPGVGLVGATGSHETLLSSAPRLLAPLLRRRHPSFPNPHLRTNGFMLGREFMLSLRWPPSAGKREAFALESGRSSITRQVQGRGLQTLVVGRDGQGYRPEGWAQSRTFRSGGQENLLIADNRTRDFAAADPARRAQLARAAWGDAAEPG